MAEIGSAARAARQALDIASILIANDVARSLLIQSQSGHAPSLPVFNSTAPIAAPQPPPKSAPARNDAAPGGNGGDFAALLDAPAAARDKPAARTPERNTNSSSDTAAPRDERAAAAAANGKTTDSKTSDPKTTDAKTADAGNATPDKADGGKSDSGSTGDIDAITAPALASVVPAIAAVVAPPVAPALPADDAAPAIDATTASAEQLALATVENNGVAITVNEDSAAAPASAAAATGGQSATGLFAARSSAAQATIMAADADGMSTPAFDAPDPGAIATAADTDAAQPANTETAPQAKAGSAATQGNATRTDTATSPAPAAARAAADAATLTNATAPQTDPAQGGQPQLSPLHAAAHTSNQMPQAPQPAVALVAPGVAVPLAGVAMNIAAHARAGKSQFDIQLDPAELGRIDVRLTVDRHGTVTSHVVVEKAETLDMLRRDAQQLQRALDDAGLKTGGGGLQFSLRDQSSSPDRDDSGSRQHQRIVVSEDVIASEAAGRSYGRAVPARGGLDIRI